MDDKTKSIYLRYQHSLTLLTTIKYNYEIVVFFNKMQLNDSFGKYILENNMFIEFSVINAFRITILDMNKLFQESFNEKFNIVSSIKNILTYCEYKYDINVQPFNEIINKINDKSIQIGHLRNLRDGIIAHSDKEFYLKENDLSLDDLRELIGIATDYHTLIKEHLIYKSVVPIEFFEIDITSHCSNIYGILKSYGIN